MIHYLNRSNGYNFLPLCLFLGLADWYIPTAGMFLWIKIKGVSDTQELIMKKALEKEVCKIPTRPKLAEWGKGRADNKLLNEMNFSLGSTSSWKCI